jgi:signal transduction histidine kinase
MTRRLLLGYLSLTAFILVVLEIPLGITFARFQRSTLEAGVRRDAAKLALASEETLQNGHGPSLQALVDQYRVRTGGRAVIVDFRGEVKADSDPLVPGVRNFLSRPEIKSALLGHEVVGRRYSTSLHETLVFVSTPVETGNVIRGAVRVTYTAAFVEARVVRGWIVLAAVGLTVLAFVFLLSVQLARSVTRPVQELEEAAARLGEGQLGARVDVPSGPPEVAVLARSFNETASKLQLLVDQQRRFAADASHQLRTPLAALRLRLENLEPAVAGEPDAVDDLQGAIAEVHRLARLVDGLLALARGEAKSLPRTAIDAAAVARDSAVRWEPLIEERSVSLAVEAPGRPVWVLATSGHLEQVVDNLVANAVDVAPAGSVVTVRVVRPPRAGEPAELHVVDQGPGMSAEQRAAAFDRFWRSTEARSKLGGSGLGLSIVQQLVTNDGGSVELLEAEGGGLDACVRLQAASSPAGGRRRARDREGPGAEARAGAVERT